MKMMRKVENANPMKIIELIEKIEEGITSSIRDYSFLYNEKEQSNLTKAFDKVKETLALIRKGNITIEELYIVLNYEDTLKPLIFKTWVYELEHGADFIYWFKKEKYKTFENAISTTFSNNDTDSFCGAKYGIAFDIKIDGFLGACNKDAATMIQDEEFLSIYTIGRTKDNQVINSYNLATPIITPKQVFDKVGNTYHSKHNEIILDAKFIKPKYAILLNDDISEFEKSLSEIYHIPVKKKEEDNIHSAVGVKK